MRDTVNCLLVADASVSIESTMSTCRHCDLEIMGDRCEHPDLCCDCYDLSWGVSLTEVNRERSRRGRPAITEPWPVQPVKVEVVSDLFLMMPTADSR